CDSAQAHNILLYVDHCSGWLESRRGWLGSACLPAEQLSRSRVHRSTVSIVIVRIALGRDDWLIRSHASLFSIWSGWDEGQSMRQVANPRVYVMCQLSTSNGFPT